MCKLKKYIILCLCCPLYISTAFAANPLANVIEHKDPVFIDHTYQDYILKKFSVMKQSVSGSQYELVYIDTKKIAKPLAEVARYSVVLLDKKKYDLHFTEIKKYSETSFAYKGKVEGYKGSSVIFVLHNGILTGSVTINGDITQILHVAKGYYALKRLDLAKLPSDKPDSVAPLPSEKTNLVQLIPNPKATSQDRTPPAQQDVLSPVSRATTHDDSLTNGSIVDVLVLYTPAALAKSGGDIVGEIQNAVEWMNVALAESPPTGVQMRLVGIRLVNYVEQGQSDIDLDRLRNKDDGYLEGIHDLRDKLGADFVAMLVSTMEPGIAGLGEVCPQGNVDCGFAVIARDWVHTTLAHELGHNFGLHHDCFVEFGFPYTSANCGSAPGRITYNYGYVHYNPADLSNLQGQNYYTIMAYYSECSHFGANCKIAHAYSSPNAFFNASTIPRGIPGVSDNVQSIQDNAFEAASHRPAKAEVHLFGDGGNKTGCFIATAAYDSYLDSHLITLRHFRDNVLLSFSGGRKFVSLYYTYSPPIATYIRKHAVLRLVIRTTLAPVVFVLEHTILFISLLLAFLLFGLFYLVIYKRRLV